MKKISENFSQNKKIYRAKKNFLVLCITNFKKMSQNENVFRFLLKRLALVLRYVSRSVKLRFLAEGTGKFSQSDKVSCFEKKYSNIFLDVRTYFSDKKCFSISFRFPVLNHFSDTLPTEPFQRLLRD